MKRLSFIRLGLACLLTMLAVAAEGQAEKKWLTYKGAWFEINYPSDFTFTPGQKSATSTQGYDSAFFASPDRSVVFYVFSPQWQGNLRETDTEIDPDHEELIEQHIRQEKDRQGFSKTIRTMRVKAKDNSYERAIRDETTATNRLVFGIKYKNRESYKKYYNEYLAFKKSLRQFAD